MKLCKDCKNFNSIKLECQRPMGISLVTGEPKFRKMSAETERGLESTGCGTDAKYFEPKADAQAHYDLVDPINFGADEYKKKHSCLRSGCTICVAFEH